MSMQLSNFHGLENFDALARPEPRRRKGLLKLILVERLKWPVQRSGRWR